MIPGQKSIYNKVWMNTLVNRARGEFLMTLVVRSSWERLEAEYFTRLKVSGMRQWVLVEKWLVFLSFTTYTVTLYGVIT